MKCVVQGIELTVYSSCGRLWPQIVWMLYYGVVLDTLEVGMLAEKLRGLSTLPSVPRGGAQDGAVR